MPWVYLITIPSYICREQTFKWRSKAQSLDIIQFLTSEAYLNSSLKKMNKLFWKVKSNIVKIRTHSQLWKLSSLFYSNLNTGTSIYLWVCRIVSGGSQPVPKDFISETYEISEQIQDYAHSFEEAGPCWKFSNCKRFPNIAGEGEWVETGYLAPLPCLLVSEHRTLRLHICNRTACLLWIVREQKW